MTQNELTKLVIDTYYKLEDANNAENIPLARSLSNKLWNYMFHLEDMILDREPLFDSAGFTEADR